MFWNLVWATGRLLETWHILARNGTLWTLYRADTVPVRPSAFVESEVTSRRRIPRMTELQIEDAVRLSYSPNNVDCLGAIELGIDLGYVSRVVT